MAKENIENTNEEKIVEVKKKNGAGKFFLGALIGGVAGFVASRFVSIDVKKEKDIDDEDECENEECECEECECEDCKCKKEEKKEAEAKKSEEKAEK